MRMPQTGSETGPAAASAAIAGLCVRPGRAGLSVAATPYLVAVGSLPGGDGWSALEIVAVLAGVPATLGAVLALPTGKH